MRKAKKLIPIRLQCAIGKSPKFFRDLQDNTRAEWHFYSGWIAMVTLEEYHEAIGVGAEDIIVEKSSFIGRRIGIIQ